MVINTELVFGLDIFCTFSTITGNRLKLYLFSKYHLFFISCGSYYVIRLAAKQMNSISGAFFNTPKTALETHARERLIQDIFYIKNVPDTYAITRPPDLLVYME